MWDWSRGVRSAAGRVGPRGRSGRAAIGQTGIGIRLRPSARVPHRRGTINIPGPASASQRPKTGIRRPTAGGRRACAGRSAPGSVHNGIARCRPAAPAAEKRPRPECRRRSVLPGSERRSAEGQLTGSRGVTAQRTRTIGGRGRGRRLVSGTVRPTERRGATARAVRKGFRPANAKADHLWPSVTVSERRRMLSIPGHLPPAGGPRSPFGGPRQAADEHSRTDRPAARSPTTPPGVVQQRRRHRKAQGWGAGDEPRCRAASVGARRGNSPGSRGGCAGARCGVVPRHGWEEAERRAGVTWRWLRLGA